MGNRFIFLAALSGFIAVAFGAFAAHGLALSPQHAEWIDKGWRYQAFHTVALLALGFFVAAGQQTTPACRQSAVNIIGFSWLLGIVGFSFGLYAMALFDSTAFVMVVPFGGTLFLIGWAALAYVAWRNLKK